MIWLFTLREHYKTAVDLLEKTMQQHEETILNISQECLQCLRNKGKIVALGNGGSYADALHFAAEFEGSYRNRQRPALPVIVPANAAAQTAIANDFSFDLVFRRFVSSHVNASDLVIGYSTSGNSRNVIEAFIEAHNKGARTIALTGESGGKIIEYSDIILNVPSTDTPRIQEVHQFISHEVCDLVEKNMFGS